MTETQPAAIELVDVDAGYGRRTIVHGLSISLRRGDSLVLLGQNGAGKSTLLRAIFGLNNLQSGTITVAGEQRTAATPFDRIRQGIAYVPQGRGVFQDLSVRDNLRTSVVAFGRDSDSAVAELLARFPELDRLAASKAGVLSGGQARLLAIGMALVRRPKWLLLDEPTIGLSPERIDTVFSLLRDLQDNDQIGLLVAEQNVAAAVKWFDRGIGLRSGSMHWSGDCASLRSMSAVELAGLL